jgi:uncharacterized protein involved in response to NO
MTDLAADAQRSGPTVLAFAFRPFFLVCAAYAVVLVIAWMGVWVAGWPLAGDWMPARWHAHEMLFGMVTAAIAGFLLTAMCNWTGAKPIDGAGLAGLVLLWLAGRVAMWLTAWLPAGLVMVIDLSFLVAVAASAAFVIVRADSRRNLTLIGVLGVLLMAQSFSHLGQLWLDPDWQLRGQRLGLFLIVMLMIIIGGRITPAFTRNWLMRQGANPAAVRSWPWIERLGLASAVLVIVAVVAGVPMPWFGLLALFAGVIHAIRLVGWSGWLGWSEPLIWILHVGYAWVVAGLLLLGLSNWLPILETTWLHALGAGAMGTLILGVMTRVSLGHTGRPLQLPRGAGLIYLLIIAAGLLRVLSSQGLLIGPWPLLLASVAWVAAFALFLVLYIGILTSPRADGRPG